MVCAWREKGGRGRVERANHVCLHIYTRGRRRDLQTHFFLFLDKFRYFCLDVLTGNLDVKFFVYFGMALIAD